MPKDQIMDPHLSFYLNTGVYIVHLTQTPPFIYYFYRELYAEGRGGEHAKMFRVYRFTPP